MEITRAEKSTFRGILAIVAGLMLYGGWFYYLDVRTERYQLFYDTKIRGKWTVASDPHGEIELKPNGQWMMSYYSPELPLPPPPPVTGTYSINGPTITFVRVLSVPGLIKKEDLIRTARLTPDGFVPATDIFHSSRLWTNYRYKRIRK